MRHSSPPPEQTGKQIRFAAYLLMASSLLSSLLGFARDAIFARLIGANEYSDVYLASFTIPDVVNRLLASGALSIAFVPLLAKFVGEHKEQLANDVYRAIATLMGTLMALTILVASIYAYELGRFFFPGFSPEQSRLLADLVRIILPAQFFFYWGGLAISVQYTHKRFLFPAFAPLLYNLGIIGFGIALHQGYGVKGFSIGVLLGSVAGHGILQLFGVHRLGYSSLPLFRFTPEIRNAVKNYIYLVLPIMVGFFSFVLADEWLLKSFASGMQEGAVSWLSYARREMYLPVQFVAQAFGIASFPFLANHWAAGRKKEFGETVLMEIKRLWAAAPLAAILVGIHAVPMTFVIFHGKKFTLTDVHNTAAALQILSFGIFFWAVRMILSRSFYACQNTWLPNVIGGVVTLVILPLYPLLGKAFGYLGIAMTGSIGIFLFSTSLGVFTWRLLKAHCPEIEYRNFVGFCFQWSLFLLFSTGTAWGIHRMGIYQETITSALLEIGLSAITIAPLGLFLIRTYFTRFTNNEPLF